MKRLISFDIKSDFGFLKKPDTNEPMYLTFNMIHKPCVLGILGAILGKQGFQESEVLPDYYQALKDTLIGIKPLDAEKGTFPKMVVQYNNGVGYASRETGGNLIVTEQTLVRPSYRIYLLTDQQDLIERIRKNKAEFLPYLGKNDFSLWWENVRTYDFKPFEPNESYRIDSLFIKNIPVKEGKEKMSFSFLDFDLSADDFIYFERLPIGYDEELYQYEYEAFAYTSFKLDRNYEISNLYKLMDTNEIVQVF